MLFALFLCRKQSESFDKFWRCIIIKEQQINEEFRDKEIRVMGERGAHLGLRSATSNGPRVGSCENFSECCTAGV